MQTVNSSQMCRVLRGNDGRGGREALLSGRYPEPLTPRLGRLPFRAPYDWGRGGGEVLAAALLHGCQLLFEFAWFPEIRGFLVVVVFFLGGVWEVWYTVGKPHPGCR